MSKYQDKRVVKYDCLVIKEEYQDELRDYMQWALYLHDHFLDKWKKYD